MNNSMLIADVSALRPTHAPSTYAPGVYTPIMDVLSAVRGTALAAESGWRGRTADARLIADAMPATAGTSIDTAGIDAVPTMVAAGADAHLRTVTAESAYTLTSPTLSARIPSAGNQTLAFSPVFIAPTTAAKRGSPPRKIRSQII